MSFIVFDSIFKGFVLFDPHQFKIIFFLVSSIVLEYLFKGFAPFDSVYIPLT